MKKTLLTLAVALIATVAGVQAQESNKFNEQKWVIGGTAHFANHSTTINDNTNDGSTQIGAEIFAGHQLNDRWRVGLTYGMGYARMKQPIDQTIRTYRVGPYVHFDIIKYNRWILWAEAEALFAHAPKMVISDMDFLSGEMTPSFPYGTAPEAMIRAFNFTVKPGITFVLDKHVNIDFNLNLLGWYYGNARGEVLTSSPAAGVSTGDVMEVSDNGLILDLLHTTASQYLEKVAIGITFKL